MGVILVCRSCGCEIEAAANKWSMRAACVACGEFDTLEEQLCRGNTRSGGTREPSGSRAHWASSSQNANCDGTTAVKPPRRCENLPASSRPCSC